MEQIRLVKITHVYYQYRNLKEVDAFLQDFGLQKVKSDETRIYYRGTGCDPFVLCAEKAEEDCFGGAAFAVETMDDLVRATKISEASAIRDLDAPGGGKVVTIRDPIDNMPFHLVYGQRLEEEQQTAEERPFNFVSNPVEAIPLLNA